MKENILPLLKVWLQRQSEPNHIISPEGHKSYKCVQTHTGPNPLQLPVPMHILTLRRSLELPHGELVTPLARLYQIWNAG